MHNEISHPIKKLKPYFIVRLISMSENLLKYDLFKPRVLCTEKTNPNRQTIDIIFDIFSLLNINIK
jgi:hypothetical protein